jgi:hypothetical protein
MLQMVLLCIIMVIVRFKKRVKIMGMQIELLRNKLEKLISVADSLVDSEIISVSQQLDKLILQYYLCEC